MEYKNGTKATWRYWAWKRLRERIKVHPRFATILFLSGPSPEDLAAAIKNGFRIENIVAIDTDANAVSEARKSGCIAIQGDIHDVASLWDDGDIHGCIADYCCGLSYEQFVNSFGLLFCVNGPVVLNFQRGRESSEASGHIRKMFQQNDHSKHRGEQFVTLSKFQLAMDTFQAVHGKAKTYEEFVATIALHASEWSEMCRYSDNLVGNSSPDFYEYTSNRVKMDTVVLSFQIYSNGLGSRERAIVSALADSENNYHGIQKIISRKRKTISRLTATKAVRTMKGAVRLDNGRIIQ